MSEVSTGSELSAVEVAALAKRGDTVSQRRFVGVHILLLLGGVLMVFPFVYQILMSLSTNMEIQSVPPKLIPDRWQFHNYTEVFTRLPFLKQFGVSVTITVLRTVVQLILCSMGGICLRANEVRWQVGSLRVRPCNPHGARAVVSHRPVRDHSRTGIVGDAMGHRPSWLLLGFRSVSHAAVLHEPAGRAGGGRKARWLQSVADVLASHGARRQTRLVRGHDHDRVVVLE